MSSGSQSHLTSRVFQVAQYRCLCSLLLLCTLEDKHITQNVSLAIFLVFILISGHTFRKYGELLCVFTVLLLQCSRKRLEVVLEPVHQTFKRYVRD
jgi:hypothetical protein